MSARLVELALTVMLTALAVLMMFFIWGAP